MPHKPGNKRILRTIDTYSSAVAEPEIEDRLGETLVNIANDHSEIDATVDAAA